MVSWILAMGAAGGLAAWSAPAVRCGLGDVLAARDGLGPSLHPQMRTPPARLRSRPVAPAPPGGKGINGNPYEVHVESEHFTVNWTDPSGSMDDAAWVAQSLEEAWAVYVDTLGWPQPVSSDRYLLWVLLDTSLSGLSGYTTVYASDEYPEGYPVIFLNPAYLHERDWYWMLVAHELMHAIQFAMRSYWDGGEDEYWYWEASAQWAPELAQPSNDTYATCAPYYTQQAELRFDSVDGFHQYGMFLLNAHLDEQHGSGTMQAIWERSTARPSDTWDVIIADELGQEADTVWAAFSAAVGNQQLADSPIFEPVRTQGVVADQASAELPYLGSHFYQVDRGVRVRLETPASGGIILSGPRGSGTEISLAAGELLAVTGTDADLQPYRLGLEADTGVGEPGSDTGVGAGSDDAGDGLVDDTPVSGTQSLISEPRGGCGCAAGPASLPGLALGLLMVLGWRREPHPTD